jgi:pyruvate dehydrogenase E2 component (dihydrolipoyllysine-residue acetyltransferase)
MTLAIGATPAAPYVATTAPAPAARATAAPATTAVAAQAAHPAAAAAPAAAPATGGQQQAALNQLLSKYRYGQSHNVAASTLSSLGRQILAEAKTLGQHVTLPRAPAGAGAAPAAVANATPVPGKVSVTA